METKNTIIYEFSMIRYRRYGLNKKYYLTNSVIIDTYATAIIHIDVL